MTSEQSCIRPRERRGRHSFSEGRGWRTAARVGARYGPRWWLNYSPPVFGIAFGIALADKRAKVLENLRRVLGVRPALQELRDVAATFSCYAACLAEGLASGRPEAERLRISLAGEERLDACARGGRGVVVVTAHVGPWEAAAQALSRHGVGEVRTVMAPEPALAARTLHDSVREAAGVSVHHSGGEPLAALDLLRFLRNGGVVAAQIDRCPPEARSMRVPFFGQSVGVPLGPFHLAALAGAPVIPVFVSRSACFDYEGEVRPALYLPRRPGESELRGVVQQATSAMEAFIRQHPTQWFHFSDG